MKPSREKEPKTVRKERSSFQTGSSYWPLTWETHSGEWRLRCCCRGPPERGQKDAGLNKKSKSTGTQILNVLCEFSLSVPPQPFSSCHLHITVGPSASLSESGIWFRSKNHLWGAITTILTDQQELYDHVHAVVTVKYLWTILLQHKHRWVFIVSCEIWWKQKWNNWFGRKSLLQNVQKRKTHVCFSKRLLFFCSCLWAELSENTCSSHPFVTCPRSCANSWMCEHDDGWWSVDLL